MMTGVRPYSRGGSVGQDSRFLEGDGDEEPLVELFNSLEEGRKKSV